MREWEGDGREGVRYRGREGRGREVGEGTRE